MFACVPNPGKQSIWRQCPRSARKHSTKKLPNRPGFTHVQEKPSCQDLFSSGFQLLFWSCPQWERIYLRSKGVFAGRPASFTKLIHLMRGKPSATSRHTAARPPQICDAEHACFTGSSRHHVITSEYFAGFVLRGPNWGLLLYQRVPH